MNGARPAGVSGPALPALPLAAGAFAAGTAAAALLGGPWWASAAIAAVLAVALALRPGTRVSPLVLVAAVALAAAGHARFAEVQAQPPPALASLEGEHALVGVARGDAAVDGRVARLDLDIERIDGMPASGGLRLRLLAPGTPLRAGDRIAFTATIERPPEIADFDYASYLRSRDVYAVASYPRAWSVLARDTGSPPLRALRALHRRLLANLDRALPEPEAALAAGMLIGERRSMPAALADDLRVTGTSHLVVVSGQNVALLLGTAIALLTAAISRRRAAIVALALLPPYLLLVGPDPPVVRAAIMAVGLAVAAVAGRRTPSWVYLLYAAAAMLAVDPLLARSVAFQLSISATTGVMLLAPPLRDRLLARGGGSEARGAIVEAAATAAAAAVAVVPVQAAAFERVSLLSIPANVAVAPLYAGTLVVALAGALLGWLPAAATAIAEAGRLVPAAFIAVVGALARVPAGTLPLRVPLVAGVLWYAAAVALTWWLARAEPLALAVRPRSRLMTTLPLAAIAGGLWLAVLTPGDRLASVTVLDVGQGLSILVRDGGAAVLVDAGPPDGAAAVALPRAGAGRALDAVVLTHGDADHSGGLPEIERRFTVGHVLGDAAVAAEPLSIGDRIRLSDRTAITVLGPPQAATVPALVSPNNRSLVLLVTIGERRVLITADIEAPAEHWLATRGLDLRGDVLVVPHHGSQSASTRELIDAVQPRVAVISVGARNPYGHPHPEVLRRYEASAIAVLRTDQAGDVRLSSDGDGLWVRTAR